MVIWKVAEAKVSIFSLDIMSALGSWLEIIWNGGYFALAEGAKFGRLTRWTTTFSYDHAWPTSLNLPPKTKVTEVLMGLAGRV